MDFHQKTINILLVNWVIVLKMNCSKYILHRPNKLIKKRCITLGDDCNLDLDALIKERLNNTDNWVLIGGPPCQAYSLVGKARNKGNREYKAEDDPRHFLYKEYLRIIKKFRPAVFVMENVKGILSSRIDGDLIFHHILDDLEQAGYRIHSLVKTRQPDSRPDPHDFVICSEQYGIPQKRHRVIVLGVSDDIKKEPELLSDLP
jgi:DNA (cytosine-5)-methyltransferase 1